MCLCQPYRVVLDASTCILCGRERGRLVTAHDKCACMSMTYCHACKSDDELVTTSVLSASFTKLINRATFSLQKLHNGFFFTTLS